MGIHNVLSLFLAAAICLLLASSGSALSTSQQLRGASSRAGKQEHLQAAEAQNSDSDSETDENEDDEDDDDKETPQEKAADKAREELKQRLERRVKLAKAKLEKNTLQQEQINAQIEDIESGGSILINANAKAVANETESATMGNYLGDMWKEMRTFASPFYQEHIMEQREHLKRKLPVLQKRYEADLLRLQRQKLEWAEEDAKADADDETDPEKKEEDLKKVSKLKKEERQVERKEKVVEREEKALSIFGPPPWMKDKKANTEAAEKEEQEAEEPAEDNQMKPEWMKALEARGFSTEGAIRQHKRDEEEKSSEDKAASTKTEDSNEEEDEDKEGTEKNKDKKKAKPSKGDDDEEEDVEKEKTKVKAEPSEDDGDSEDSAAEETSSEAKKPAKVSVKPRGKHEAMFTEKTMPDVSPTVKCVTSLAWLFFIVYTAMAVLRTVNQISQNRFPSCLRLQDIVGRVMPFVMFAPMLSVLFLATRMRAIQLAQGDTEKYELPQPWVQFAMYTATIGVIFQVVFKLLTFRLTQRVLPDGSTVPGHIDSMCLRILCTILNTACMACIYVGFSAVCLGAIIMPAPSELWGDDPPKVSAALSCTMILTTTFFAIYLGLWLFRSLEEMRPRVLDKYNTLVKVQLLFWRVSSAVNLAPMLCVLFIVARMRALQMDPENGNPPSYAQWGMYAAAGAMVFQVVASIALPLIDRNAYIELPGRVQGQIILRISNPWGIISDLMRYIPLLCVYGGASAVVAGVFLAKAREGQATPALSAAMNCIISLTTMYFAVFTAVFIAQTVTDRLPDGRARAAMTVLTVLDAGQRTVMLAPMLCILFIAARMRALQLTRTVDGNIPPGAGPQKWVQDGMYFATGAMFLQVLMGYLGTLFLGPGFVSAEDAQKEDPHAPKSTAPDNDLRSPSSGDLDKRLVSPGRAFGLAVNVFNFICLLGLYGGVVAVMVGTVIMTPDTLPPYHTSTGVVEGAMKLL